MTKNIQEVSALNAEETAWSQAVGHHYIQSGMDSALGYLFALWQKWGIARLDCFLYLARLDTYYDVLAVYEHSEAADRADNDFPPISYFDHNIRLVVENDLAFDPSGRSLTSPYAPYHSLVRFAFAEVAGMVYFFHVFSLSPNFFTDEVLACLQESVKPLGAALEKSRRLAENIADRTPSSFSMLSVCNGLRGVRDAIANVAPTDITVLINGETGVGKEVVADAIYEKSLRNRAPFVKLNCGAIPDTLADSMLFGHERGAFTGAVSRARGYFEQAHGGTLFLDEVGELTPMTQVRLLRVLEHGTIQRVGAGASTSVNVRVIAATNRNLLEMVDRGEFRLDLWYRLAQYPIHIPPLRERQEDILPLVEYFLKQKMYEGTARRPPLRSQSAKLLNHPWRGNVRELRYVVERAVMDWNFNPKKRLQFFSPDDPQSNPAGMGTPEKTESTSPSPPAVQPARPRPNPALTQTKALQESWPSLDELNSEYIQLALQKAHGRIDGPNGAAKILGVHPQTLYRKMKKLRMEVDGERDQT